MRYLNFIFCYLMTFAGYLAHSANAQQPAAPKFTPNDSPRVVEILYSRTLEYRKLNDTTELLILSGNVKLKQGSTYFYSDSCVINYSQNTFEAFGNVHINDSDTSHVYSDYLKYFIDKRIAYLNKRVRLTDGKATLTTEELEYDVNTKIGIYKNGGKVVNKKTVLTSKEGYYYVDIKDIYFKKDIQMTDPAFTLQTDSLLYNTETETARFVAETFIRDSSNRTIWTREGFYNPKTGKAEFGQRPVIKDGAVSITGNRIAIDDSTGIVQIKGNAVVVDTAQEFSILANEIFRNSKTETVLATNKPLLIIKQEKDSIFITADTLFFARLSDLKPPRQKSTLNGSTLKNTENKEPVIVKTNDDTDRYFEAYRNVRVFSDSLQAISDSLFYSFKDSAFRLFQQPVVWDNQNQITGDTIYLFTKNKKADRFEVFENSFIANHLEGDLFNQIKSTRMDGYFKEGNIDSIRARGSAESIYYIMDDDSAYIGINQSRADLLDVYFKNKELHKVVFRSAVKGTIWPMKHKLPAEMKLTKFSWLEEKRPKSKFELFE